MTLLRHPTEPDLKDPGAASANTLLDLLVNNTSLQRVDTAGPLDNQESHRGDLSIILPHLCEFLVFGCDAVDISAVFASPGRNLSTSTPYPRLKESILWRLINRTPLFNSLGTSDSTKFHLCVDSEFNFKIYDDSQGGITAGFGELPPNTAEVLGPLTVQFIKHLHFWEDKVYRRWHPLEYIDPLHRMERMETLALDCLPAGFEAFFLVLGMNTVVCPLLRTLIVGLPEGEPAVAWKDLVFKFAQTRASRDSAIKRFELRCRPRDGFRCTPASSTPLCRRSKLSCPGLDGKTGNIGWFRSSRGSFMPAYMPHDMYCICNLVMYPEEPSNPSQLPIQESIILYLHRDVPIPVNMVGDRHPLVE